MTEREALIFFNLVSGIGHAKYQAMLRHFGSAADAAAADVQTLSSVKGIGPHLAESVVQTANSGVLAQELEIAERAGVRIVTLKDPEYPQILRELYDPPLCLYVLGGHIPPPERSVAIVGSRRMSEYGGRMTRCISEGAAAAGFCIVSGLAYGVDCIAHRTAVELQSPTVAVLGGGLNRIHPQEHVPLARRIVETGGAVVSEFPMNFPVSRMTFPRRNRIVAGLCRAVLVMEAGLDSGALITAQMALEQGKELFAVPGHADNPQAKGCHKLIREGAVLLEQFQDVLDTMEFLPGFAPGELGEGDAPFRSAGEDLSDAERKVLEVLSAGPAAPDKLEIECGVPMGELLGTLIRLQTKLKIRKNTMNEYSLC